jgi:hypothetical protein
MKGTEYKKSDRVVFNNKLEGTIVDIYFNIINKVMLGIEWDNGVRSYMVQSEVKLSKQQIREDKFNELGI